MVPFDETSMTEEGSSACKVAVDTDTETQTAQSLNCGRGPKCLAVGMPTLGQCLHSCVSMGHLADGKLHYCARAKRNAL